MRSTQFLLSAAVASALAATGTSQHIVKSMVGDQPGANFGRTLATVDDVDGDGTRDLIVGEPNRDLGGATDCGAAALVRSGAWSIRTRTYGSQNLAHFGSGVAGLGDVDGDTIPDWAVGSPDAATGTSMVRVLSGQTGMQLFEVTGDFFSRFGASICSIGDRNGDGRADFAVGSPQNSVTVQYGTVKFFSGSNGALLATLAGTTGTQFGSAMATLGDVTGDGQPEIVIGEPGADSNGTNSGRVTVKNPRDGLTNSWVWQASPFAAGNAGGGAVAAIGDVTADGRSDLIVTTGTNDLFVLDGVTATVLRTISNAEFGPAPSVAGIGDWNGDGNVDFAVGAPTAAAGTGKVFVYSGAPGGGLLATINGTGGSLFGSAVAGLGDLDGDGRTEFAVGAPTHISNGLLVGRVTVHSFDIQPVAEAFGSGCAGQVGVPSLYFAGAPNVGGTFDILCGNLRQNAFGYLVFGFSDTTTGLFPLPLPLQALGFGAACSFYVSPDAPEPFATSGGSLLTRTMTLPNVPSLATFRFYVQACQFDGGAIGGVSFSNAGRIRIGNL